MNKFFNKFRLKKTEYIFLALITLASAIFFLFRVSTAFRMPTSYNYDSDFGRDLLRMYEILHGNFTLIGPQLNFAGLHMAPYSFYFFAPFLYLASLDHRILFYVNAFLFLFGYLILFIFLKNKWGKNFAFLSTLWLLTTPYLILSARTPGNAFSYLPLFIFVVLTLFYKNKISVKQHFLIGFLEGIIVNFHPINLLILIPLHIGRIVKKSKETFKKKMQRVLVTLLGVGLSFTPVVLFELKHSFVITRSLLNPSYDDAYLGAFKAGSSSLTQSLFNIHNATTSLIPFSMFGLLIVNILLFFKTREKRNNTLIFAVASINVALLILLKFGAVHYFLPTLLLLQLFLLIQVYEFKFKYTFLVMLIGINLIFFPVQLYRPSRNLTQVETYFNKIVGTNFLPRENLNVILLNETALSKVGYEYRFLLKKHGHPVDDEYSYKQSKYLLVIDEQSIVKDFKNEKSWEFDEFGVKELVNSQKVNRVTFFLFKKLQKK